MRVIGLMSGTSADGVDAALIETDGRDRIDFLKVASRTFSPDETAAIRAGMGAWDAAPALEAMIRAAHVEAVRILPEAELVGFHGQTLNHAPPFTFQLGDGEALAADLGVPVVWDFRTADVRAGGQGAPLAPFYHFALARKIGAEAPVAFLNLGGVGNVTWLDPRKPAPEEEGALIAFDTGPANALLNDFMTQRQGKAFDEEGRLAARGRVAQGIFGDLDGHLYLAKPGPKSLDRNDFHGLMQVTDGLSDEDGAATLTAITAHCVARAMEHMPARPERWLVCGGGRKNAAMMGMIADFSGVPAVAVEHVGLDGDMLEAQAFAYLAARVALGLPTSAPGSTGVRTPTSGGIISGQLTES
ncbi:anhydro-N-acetylmuramic acid kinase [Paracoccaceae bacterium GXU_MW_L88]